MYAYDFRTDDLLSDSHLVCSSLGKTVTPQHSVFASCLQHFVMGCTLVNSPPFHSKHDYCYHFWMTFKIYDTVWLHETIRCFLFHCICVPLKLNTYTFSLIIFWYENSNTDVTISHMALSKHLWCILSWLTYTYLHHLIFPYIYFS